MHTFYSDGNAKQISWCIQTDDVMVKQNRKHADIYFDNVTNLQSKYIALHVGLFWSIGTFVIKNGDRVLVKIDMDTMYKSITSKNDSKDEFIKNRAYFIKHLITQRQLKISYEKIERKDNLARIVI